MHQPDDRDAPNPRVSRLILKMALTSSLKTAKDLGVLQRRAVFCEEGAQCIDTVKGKYISLQAQIDSEGSRR